MSALRRVLARLAAIVRGHRASDEDLRAEMEAHLEMEVERNLRRGIPLHEARRQALVAAGGLTFAAEQARKERGLPWVETTTADIRYAVRHFRRTPLSTITMVAVLTLGIGANVLLFTLLNSLATMPAPGIARDDSLVRIRGSLRTRGTAALEPRLLSWPEVQEYVARTELFSSVAAYADEIAALEPVEGTSAPATARVIYTTSNYFPLVGVRALVGAPPPAEPDVMRSPSLPTAMISYAIWQQRFGAAPDVVGRTIRVNDIAVEIAGVAPPRFAGTDRAGAMTIWVPLAAYPVLQRRTPAVFLSVDSMFLSAAARLRPGVTIGDASPVVAGIAARTLARGQGRPAASGSSGQPLSGEHAGNADVARMLASNERVSEGRRTDLILSVAMAGGFALLILLVTCTNVSALMVGLATARRREIGVRLSLGAPRARLVRQLLTESVLLAVIAAGLVLVATTIGIRALGVMLPDVQLVIDWRVTLATGAVAMGTGILFGLSPALHATRVPVGEVLKSAAASVAATQSRLQRALVVAQVTLTQPLLVGFGAMVLTMATDVEGRGTSAVPRQIAEIEVDTWTGQVSGEERASRVAEMVERVAELPGVIAAVPMQMGTVGASLTVHPADRIAGVSESGIMRASLIAAPSGYFSAYGIPIVRGRDFDADELAPPSGDALLTVSHRVAIIGTDLARRLWGSADPLGRRLTFASSMRPDSAAMVVVGVVDAAIAGRSDGDEQIRIYVPYAAMNTGVVARTAGPALPMLNAIRRAVAAAAPRMPVTRAETMEQREAESRRKLLRAGGAVAAGGLLTLLLSAIGLYAVVSFAVGQRTREIGIRTALGEPRGQLIRTFFARGLVLCAIGLGLGLPLSMIATRVIASAVEWPVVSSPLLGVVIGIVVLLVASVAVGIPARRASTVDPIIALRTE